MRIELYACCYSFPTDTVCRMPYSSLPEINVNHIVAVNPYYACLKQVRKTARKQHILLLTTWTRL